MWTRSCPVCGKVLRKADLTQEMVCHCGEVGMSARYCPYWIKCLDISECVKCWASGNPRPSWGHSLKGRIIIRPYRAGILLAAAALALLLWGF